MILFDLQLKCQLFFFILTTNQLFDIGIMSVIMLNMVTMSMEHYGQSEEFGEVLRYINLVNYPLSYGENMRNDSVLIH